MVFPACEFVRLQSDLGLINHWLDQIDTDIIPGDIAAHLRILYSNFLQESSFLASHSPYIQQYEVAGLQNIAREAAHVLKRFDTDVEMSSLPMKTQAKLTLPIEELKRAANDAVKAAWTCAKDASRVPIEFL